MSPRQIVGRLALLLALAAVALATVSSAASADGGLPRGWDPRAVAVNHEDGNSFLLRPGQIIAGPGDAGDVQRVLDGWRPGEQHPFGLTVFTRTPQNLDDPAKEVLAAIARVRRATADRPQGPARVAPNYVFVGESTAGTPINFYGEPRIQGGPGSSVRPAPLPAALPERTTQSADGRDVHIAVLDTGMFDHEWLKGVQRAPDSADTWDADRDGYGDQEAGHGTFIAGLILQVAPQASIYAGKVLDSHGLGDDFTVAQTMEQLPPDIDIINLSLGGYTDHDAPPLAIATAMQAMGGDHAVVAAAGNQGIDRPFWPAAFPQVLGVGAVDEDAGQWQRASYSNYGKWVDATARGTSLQSTFARAKTKVGLGIPIGPFTPIITFGGWASWDGTSFATPIAAAMIARTMSRTADASPTHAEARLLAAAPPAPQPDFARAVLLDELEGRPGGER